MSIEASKWAWAQKVKNPRHKLLLLKLADSANDDGVCWPSLRTMAGHTGVSKSTLSRAAKALADAGLLRVQPTVKQDGSAGPNVYHLALGVSQIDGSVSRPKRDVTVREPSEDPESRPSTSSARAVQPPEYLGDRRWLIGSSRQGKGPFTVDLDAADGVGTCTCENRTATVCRHRRSAAVADGKRLKAVNREHRDALWDVLVELFGPAGAEQGRNARGGLVTELVAMLEADEQVEHKPEVWAAEVRRRQAALVAGWGREKATLRAFVQNFGLARNLADEGGGKGGGKHGMTAQEMFDDAMRDQAAGL